jgi:hypothetical protein
LLQERAAERRCNRSAGMTTIAPVEQGDTPPARLHRPRFPRSVRALT